MKQILETIVAIILCLSLCACGASAPEPTPEPTPNPAEILYEKYADIIDALEAEDYDAAAEALDTRRPEPEVTEVEIAMDNLWDYFEITENRREETDAEGNLTSLSISYQLALKEEYNLADKIDYPTDVAVGYEYDQLWTHYNTPCKMDFETFECDGSIVAPTNPTHESKMLHYPNASNLYNVRAICPADQSGTSVADTILVENFEVLNASGTLYLVNK